MMTHNQCLGEGFPQFTEQCQQGCFLLQGTRIGWFAKGRQSSFVTDSDAVGIVVLAMRSHGFQCPSGVNFAVSGDVEMVTDILEGTVMDMVLAASFKIQVPPLAGGGTMDDDKGDSAHSGLDTALYSDDTAYGGSYRDNHFENGAPDTF